MAGDARATDAAFARAAHIVRLDTWVPRITGVPMEPRAALAVYDGPAGRYTLFAGSGGVVRHKNDLAEILRVPDTSVRVVAQDVGGNFGTRNSFYPEFALVAWAARRLGRPVKWTCTRREAFLTDYQARDLVSTMELALDAEGTFLALRGVNTSNVGAHAVTFVPLNKGRGLDQRLPRPHCGRARARRAQQHVPLGAYRSAGRPQVMYVMERLYRFAARRHGFDRVALRRRNLAPRGPCRTPIPSASCTTPGSTRRCRIAAVALADWAASRPAARRAAAGLLSRHRYCQLHRDRHRRSRERAQITGAPTASSTW
jgi:carbon-monoxide dehydrogenase large subunit